MDLRLKELRKAAGMSQADVAERLSVKVRTYGSWERGEAKMSLDHAARCASVLGCSVDEIAGKSPRLTELHDPREAELHRCYRLCDRGRQDRLIDTARDFAGMATANPEFSIHSHKGAR